MPQERRPAGVVDRVEHAVHDHLTVVDVALGGALHPGEGFLRQACLPAHLADLLRQVQTAEDAVEGLADTADALADPRDGLVELGVVAGQERELGRVRLDRFQPHRVAHALGRAGPAFVQVHDAEVRILVDRLLLFEARPVLVLALHHRLQGRPWKPVAFAQQSTERGGREVPVRHDGVDRPVEGVQFGHRLVEQRVDVDLTDLGLLHGEQLVEPVVVGTWNGVQRARVLVVQREHKDVLHAAVGFLTPGGVNARTVSAGHVRVSALGVRVSASHVANTRTRNADTMSSSHPDGAVDSLTQEVGVPVVPRVLVDQVQHHEP